MPDRSRPMYVVPPQPLPIIMLDKADYDVYRLMCRDGAIACGAISSTGFWLLAIADWGGWEWDED